MLHSMWTSFVLSSIPLARKSCAFSSMPLRRIEIDLQPHLTNSFVAYERDNLEDDELLERALGVEHTSQNTRETFHDTIGLHAWPSGFVAAKRMLDMLPDDERNEYKVLELGCGTGIPSLAAFNAGANVICTDLDVHIISQSFREQRFVNGNTFECMKLDLLDKDECEKLIQDTAPNLIIAADCLYDATLAKAVGEIMGKAVDRHGCHALVADPGRLKGEGRELFLDGFFAEFSNNSEMWREIMGFEEVDMPQEVLRQSGASLSWCGEAETEVGIFSWFNMDIRISND